MSSRRAWRRKASCSQQAGCWWWRNCPTVHPQKKLLATYKKDYETTYKEDVSTFGGHAYDAILIVTEALKKAGTTDRAKVRDAIEGLHGLVGTAGIYNFSPPTTRGWT